MTIPIKFLQWVVGIAFIIGLADGFGNLTYQMAKAAVHAHQNEQILRGNFSRMLWKGSHRESQKLKMKPRHP